MAQNDQTTDAVSAAVDADTTIRLNPVNPAANQSVSAGSARLPSPQAALPSVADAGKIRFGAAFRLVPRK